MAVARVVCVAALTVLVTATIPNSNANRRHHHHPAPCPNCVLHDRVPGHHPPPPAPPPPPPPPSPSRQPDADRLRLEAIKSQILSKLGLREKPNVTHSMPKEMVLETLFRAEDVDDDDNDDDDAFAEGAARRREWSWTTEEARDRHDGHAGDQQDYDDFYARTSEIISFAEQGSTLNRNRLLEFSISPEAGGSMTGGEFRVRTAALWLKADYKAVEEKKKKRPKCRHTEIYVFKIISDRLPESVTLSNSQFDRVTAEPVSAKLEERSSGWQKLDVTETVRSWLSTGGAHKLKLFVDCACCANWRVHLFNGARGEDERDGRTGGENPNRPFLVIHTDPNATKRVRRRALECTPDSGNQCCKQRFYVSFKALGWDDWVIAPQGYYANYCRGDCGQHRTPDTYATYHTHVLEEARKSHHLSGVQPCCAPLKFSSVSLIYYGPNRDVIKRDLPKMVVDECGCP